MKYDQIWQVRYQLNGCYMPDSFALFSSKRQAISCAYADACEAYEHVREEGRDTVYYFTREESQEWSRENDEYPYMIVVEPVSWRDIANSIGVTTRAEVLDYDSYVI